MNSDKSNLKSAGAFVQSRSITASLASTTFFRLFFGSSAVFTELRRSSRA
jgi:hypothetical protein